MKSTFFAILASAAVVLASPLPEAGAHQGQAAPYAPSYDGGDSWGPPPRKWGGSGRRPSYDVGRASYRKPADPSYDDPSYEDPTSDDPSYDDPSYGGSVSGHFEGEFSGTYYTTHGYAPPQEYGYESWPQGDEWDDDSPFKGGNLDSIGDVCSAKKQAVSCCTGASESTGLLGGLLSSGSCTLNLLSCSSKQDVRCCSGNTQNQNGLINIQSNCGDVIPISIL